MARKPRVVFLGAFYHVIARGNQRQAIFHDDTDRTYYLDRLEHYRARYQVTVSIRAIEQGPASRAGRSQR